MTVWIGDFGDYEIPVHLQSIRITKSGWPDKRDKLYNEFMEWAKDK
jgi:hypothetical protein